MDPVNRKVQKTYRPVNILQYGEGNFLRGFMEYMVDVANEKGVFDGGVQLVKPIPYGSLEPFAEQDCVYTVILRGKKNGARYVEKRIITCVNGAVSPYEEYEAYAAFAKSPELKLVVSNTTEAGIVYDACDDIAKKPPESYPGKLTKFLYERYQFFSGAKDKGLIILPMELIDKNGETLKSCCLRLAQRWNLPADFTEWLAGCNVFCNTLVDRIITGYPKGEAGALERELGYSDKLLVTGEPFALWVIESDNPAAVAEEFPLDRAGLPVVFTDDLQPYRQRKVRILNGAHTSSVLAAYLSGLDTVLDMMQNETMRLFIERVVYHELAPMVPLPDKEVRAFADSVMERFENPFIKHSLLSIALNSVSKFKARILPTILETQEKTGALPVLLCFSMAALIAFYSGKPGENKLIGTRDGESYDIMDDAPVLAFFEKSGALPAGRLTREFLSRDDFWGRDLTLLPGFSDAVADALQSIRDNGMAGAVERVLR
ncbi:MAG: tagaturonate reductase [Oscillospiraceae bacterium]|nr:tagaturonate reductase [Oscillospiraceae bacterium]